MVDLPGTMLDLPDSIVDLPDTMVDLTGTMLDLPDTMVDLPDSIVDLPGTMVDLPDTVVDLPDTKGWSLYQVYPVWIYPKCDLIFPNMAGLHNMEYPFSSFIFQMGPAQPGLLV